MTLHVVCGTNGVSFSNIKCQFLFRVSSDIISSCDPLLYICLCSWWEGVIHIQFLRLKKLPFSIQYFARVAHSYQQVRPPSEQTLSIELRLTDYDFVGSRLESVYLHTLWSSTRPSGK